MNSSEIHKKKKLVVITSRFPFPLEKGDKLRAYHQIKYLSQHFEIHLISISEKNIQEKHIKELTPYCKSIHVYTMNWLQIATGLLLKFLENKPLQVGYFYHYSIQKKINAFLEKIKPDHIYCQLIRASEYVKNYHECSKTIDYMDAFSKGIERRAKNTRFLKKYIFEMEHKRLLKYENSIFEYFEHHTIISEQDKNYIFHKNRDRIKVIPNGISSDFLENQQNSKKDCDLVFIGNMSYPPNVGAAQFIVNDILPQLPKETKVKIVGASPSKEVQKLSSSQVKVVGYVDDIKAAYTSAVVFVAPMFIGTGLQNKLLESMALGIPCVTTSLANNALGAKPEEEILIADDVFSFVKQVQRLQTDPELHHKISQNGRAFILQNYPWDSITAGLKSLINNK